MNAQQRAARDRAVENLQRHLGSVIAEQIVDDIILAATPPEPSETEHVQASRLALANEDPRRG